MDEQTKKEIEELWNRLRLLESQVLKLSSENITQENIDEELFKFEMVHKDDYR